MSHKPKGPHRSRRPRDVAGHATETPALAQLTRALLSLPFDTVRAQYALAIKAGVIENSLLASSRFEHALGSLELLTYGPFARRV